MRCARHPQVETALTCTRCETPICPECLVPGAVGMLCRHCARSGNPLYDIPVGRFVFTLLAGVAAGTLAGFALQMIGFFIFFVGPMIGGLVGEVVLRATGRKRGPKVEFLTAASVVVGALLSLAIDGAWVRYWHNPAGGAIFLLALALTAGAALAKVRYW